MRVIESFGKDAVIDSWSILVQMLLSNTSIEFLQRYFVFLSVY